MVLPVVLFAFNFFYLKKKKILCSMFHKKVGESVTFQLKRFYNVKEFTHILNLKED